MKIKTLFEILLLMLFFIATMSINVLANTLTLKITTDETSYEIDDKIVITVDWTEKMQAASFTIKYNSDNLEFEVASIASTFYNTEKKGEIVVNWASMEEKDLTKMTFEFKAIKAGEVEISIKEVEAFADGNLVTPTSYEFTTLGNKNIIINSKDENQKNNKEDNTTASKIIPNTGIEKTILLVIIILFVCAVMGFAKYRRLSDI